MIIVFVYLYCKTVQMCISSIDTLVGNLQMVIYLWLYQMLSCLLPSEAGKSKKKIENRMKGNWPEISKGQDQAAVDGRLRVLYGQTS